MGEPSIYQAQNGAMIFLNHIEGTRKWYFRFAESKLIFECSNKFECFFVASRKMRKSMKSLNWEPL